MGACFGRVAAAAAILVCVSARAAAQPATTSCPNVASSDWHPDSQTVFIVSSREPSCARGVMSLTNERASQLNFGEANGFGSSARFAQADWDQWWLAFSERLKSAPTHRALIFVHGYNNSAVQALDRARAIGVATGFDGPIVAFIWPSQHDTFKYVVDEANSEWTTTYLRWLLERVLPEPSRTIVVSHSMGNRITWTAIRELALVKPGLTAKIGHFVMASPDVDRGSLARDLGPDFASLPAVTIYASSKDSALQTSKLLHHYRRAGDFGPRTGNATPTSFPIASTNTTLVDTNAVRHKNVGHADFIETPEGAADLCRVISEADASVGRTATALPHTWQLLRNPHANDACTRQGANAASLLAN